MAREPRTVALDAAAFCSLVGALDGNFEELARRLRSDVELDELERAQLASLLEGSHWTSIVKRRDRRRGTKRHFEPRMKLGHRVHLLIEEGHSHATAVKIVAESLPNGGDLKAIRKAYREFKDLGAIAQLTGEGEPIGEVGRPKDPPQR